MDDIQQTTPPEQPQESSQDSSQRPQSPPPSPKVKKPLPRYIAEPPKQGGWCLLLGVALPGALLSLILWLSMGHLSMEAEPALASVWFSAAILAVAAAGCAVWALAGDRSLPGLFWAGVSGIYCLWLLYAGWVVIPQLDDFENDLMLLACSLAMTIVIVSMLRLIKWLTPPDRPHSVGKPLLSLLILPVLYYLAVVISEYAYSDAWTAVLLVLAVASTYGFVLLLIRTLYLTLYSRLNSPVLRAIVLFVLPLLGLLVSQMTLLSDMFWNFSSPLYYILVVVNGVLLLLPEPKGALRLALHFARGAMFLFAVYFFVCLSPYYALSLLGMLALGAGLLVLSPLFLLLYQVRILLASFRSLRADYGLFSPIVIFLLGMLLLPAGLALSFTGDNQNLDLAMTYVDGSAGEDAGRVNIPALERSLYYMTDGYQSDGAPPPLISGMYRHITSGSRTLSNNAYLQARLLFLNDPYVYNQINASRTVRREGTPTVVVSDIEIETVRDGEDYRSTLHFTIENTGTEDLGEYATSFHLPDGVYISGYYLDVADERKQGLLTVRDAAIWIYERTVSSARDPGILYYDGENIVFRVFPFAQGEIRRTGIEFLHRDTAELQIAGRTLTLAPDAPLLQQPVAQNGAIYISAAAKQDLGSSARRARYVFVVDCSGEANRAALTERVSSFCTDNHISAEDATVVALNYRSASWPMTADWQAQLQRFPLEGGYGLERALDRIYAEFSVENAYPVVVAVTNNMQRTPLPQNAAYAASLCPELEGFLQLGADGLTQYPFDGGEPVALGSLQGTQPVLITEAGGRTVYLYNNGQPQVVTFDNGNTGADIAATGWAAALQLQGQYAAIHTTAGEQRSDVHIALIQNSFRTGVMTPLTSYIVLETAEQEAALLEKQKQILEQGFNQTSTGQPVHMSEPPLLVCAVLALGALWLVRRRRRAVP